MIRILTAAFVLLSSTAAWSADAPASAPETKKEATSKDSSATAAAKPAAPADAIMAPAKPFVYTPKESDIVIGKNDAPVTLVEYGSLSCPHCSHFYTDELPKLADKYIDTGKVRLVFRSFLRNEPDLNGSKLIECADPEHREAYLKVLLKTQMKWAYDTNFREALGNVAVLGGMDRLSFEACMNNKDIEKTVLNVGKEGEEDYKISSTPTFFINNVQHKGRFDSATLSSAIDLALDKVQKK